VRIAPNPAASAALLKRIRSERPARSGLHLSGLVYCLRKTWHREHHPQMWAEGGPYGESDDLTLKFTLGETVHRVLGGGTEATKTKEADGILYTPDEVVLTERMADGRKRIVEFKTTAYSARKTPQDMPQYFDQLGGYAAYEGTTLGRLFIIHTRGYYNAKGPDGKSMGMDPVLKCYDVEFDPVELAGWRRELARRKALVEGAPTFQSIPLEDVAWDFECPHCPLLGEVCEGLPRDQRGSFIGRLGAFQHFVELDELSA
jgi:hypothetical protein